MNLWYAHACALTSSHLHAHVHLYVIKVLLGAGLLVGVSVLGLLRALAMTAILMGICCTTMFSCLT